MMVAGVLLTVVSISLVGVMGNIGRQIQGSKSLTLATNLAQEKMQILKQQAFNRILVTTATAFLTDPNIGTVPFDPSYYPPEFVFEGGIAFQRYTHVQVVTENSGALSYLGSVPDTGMKSLVVTVVWAQGAEKRKVQARSVTSNIDTTMSNAIIKGKITVSTNAATGIPNALVTMAENAGYRDSTDASGNFSVNLAPGSYTMNVTAVGYFPYYQTISVAPNATVTQNVGLPSMSSGTVRGTAWINDHIVISQVVGSTLNAAGFCQEFVEVFNPTTATVALNGNVLLKYQLEGELVPTPIQVAYTNTSVPAGSYFLYANTSPVTMNGQSRVADAIFSNLNAGYPDLIHVRGPSLCAGEFNLGKDDAIGLSTFSGGWIDLWGWSSGGGAPEIFEGSYFFQGNGLRDNEQFVRRSSTAGVTSGYGRAYDTNNNNVDIINAWPIVHDVKNSAITETVTTGQPAYGAYVTATDGLSQLTTAVQTGAPPYAEFLLTSVATGTWTVYLASGSAMAEVSSVTVSASATTLIPNYATVPTWLAAGNNAAMLRTEAYNGYIAGSVKSAFGASISPSISINANSFTALASVTNGTYFISAPPGTYDVIANPNNLNSLYVYQTMPSVTVTLGAVTNNVNFSLFQGGQARGFCTRDGVNALPGVAFEAFDVNDISRDQEVSSTDGTFKLVNLATGTYYVMPSLEAGEAVTPSSVTVNITAGSNINLGTFTVTGAYGFIRGSVTEAGAAIRSGVLVICSTSTLASGPPTLDNAVVSQAAYYTTNSVEDGTYLLEVRGSTVPYKVYAYYPKFTGSNVSFSTGSATSVTVTAGASTTGVNFAF